MNRYALLVNQKATAAKALRLLLDGAVDAETKAPRGLTPEESTKAGELEAAIKALAEEIAREDRLRAAEAAAPATVLLEGRQAPARVTRDLDAEKPWSSLGEWFQAARQSSMGHGRDPRLDFLAAASGMSEGVGADGGYAVPPQFAAGIERTMWEQGQILSRVSDIPIEGNTMTFNVINETSRADGSRWGGVLGYWVDEAVAATATAPKLAQVELKLRKVAALGYTTEELEQDASALSAALQEAFVNELIFQVENAIIRGEGAVKPLGILNAPCLVSVSKETGQAAATILTTNLSKMWARLPAASKANAVWIGNVENSPQLDELAIPAGTAALGPRFIDYGPEGTLRIKGHPYLEVEYCAALGTVGDIILADFSAYRMIRKAAGVQTASSIHVLFTTGQNTYRAMYRVDGQPLPRAAITPFKGTATLSPFVALATRA